MSLGEVQLHWLPWLRAISKPSSATPPICGKGQLPAACASVRRRTVAGCEGGAFGACARDS